MGFESNIPPEKKEQAKALYQSSRRSCREIGLEIGVNGVSIQTWARREGWLRPGISSKVGVQSIAKAKFEQRLESKIQHSVNSVAERATKLVERTLNESEEWLDAIAEKRRNDDMDAEECAKLVNAWKVPIEMARRALGMDADDGRTRITAELRLQVVEIGPESEPKQVTIDVETCSDTGARALSEGTSVEPQ